MLWVLMIACSQRGAAQADSIGGLIMVLVVPGEVQPDERRAWEALSTSRIHGESSLQIAAARAGALDPTVDFAPPLEGLP